MPQPQIVTIGLSPCWDVTCWSGRFEWGAHQKIDRQVMRPAGKALNVSQALRWMGVENAAAGIWGSDDYDAMLTALGKDSFIHPAFTPVPGRTRLNITLVEQSRSKEMHLRAPNELLSREAFSKLKSDLNAWVGRDSICVFAGSMPENFLLEEVLELITFCQKKGSKIVVDTSGAPLNAILELGHIWGVKPNVHELGELMGVEIDEEPVSDVDFREVLEGRVVDKTAELIDLGQELTKLAEFILISRGSRGAVAVSSKRVWQAHCVSGERNVLSTVACGDYFLAGFLAGYLKSKDIPTALDFAIKAGTLKAWGLERQDWLQVNPNVEVKVADVSLP